MGLIDKKVEELFKEKFPEIEKELKETILLGSKSAEERAKEFEKYIERFRKQVAEHDMPGEIKRQLKEFLKRKEIKQQFDELIEKKLKDRGL